MVGAAVFDILFNGKTKTDQHGGVDGAIGGHNDLRRLRQMFEHMRPRLVEAGFIKEIGLGENDEIGAGDLVLENFLNRIIVIKRLVIGPLSSERLHVVRDLSFSKGGAIHHGHDGVHGHAALDGRPLESLDQRLRQGKTRGLDQDMLHLRLAAENLFDRGLEIVSHRAADTAVGQFDDVFFGAAFNAAAFQDFAVDTDIAEFIDDDCEPLAVQLFQKTPQQRRFSRP